MFINDEKYLKFLIENRLNANQFLFCYLLATVNRNHKYMVRYTKEVSLLSADEVSDLVERGYLADMNSPGETYHDMYIVLDKFKDLLFIDSEVAFEAVWKKYPRYLQERINGKEVSAKTTGLGKDGLAHKYGKYIGNDIQKHERVLEALDWAIDNGKVTLGIEKFVLNHIWDDWLMEKEERRNNEHGNAYNIDVV